jgi:hypothetical protein
MKKIFCIVYSVFSLALLSCSGDIFDNIKEHASTEKVYVGKYDKADIYVGINRLEIDLLEAGRIPADQVSIGKALNTIVEYDGIEHTYPGVHSWINIPNLTEQKLYRIKIYNVDELGNKSLPVEAAAIPFTDDDVAVLTVPVPQKLVAPTSMQLNWPTGLTSTFFEFHEMEYTYTDAAGVSQTDTSSNENSILVLNLAEASAGTVHLKLKVVPKQDEVPILDTVYLETSIDYQLPTKAAYLAARTSRAVRLPLIENNLYTLIWDASTDHLAFCEIRYQTVSSETRIVRGWADEATTECPGIAPNSLFATRSAFVPPGSIDTLYHDWVPYPYPFIPFAPTGTYNVRADSWRANAADNTPDPDFPQSEFAEPRTVTITNPEPGIYRISDIMGGFYYVGRGYSDYEGMEPDGDFIPSYGPWTLVKVQPEYWGAGYSGISGSFDAQAKILYLDVAWNYGFIFHLILEK